MILLNVCLLRGKILEFEFLEVNSNELLDKVYRFRYKILCEELKVFDRNSYPYQKETDQYDPSSIHFAAVDENGEVAACVRLIHHSPVGYPTENGMVFDIDKNIFERDKVGEVSRIFIDSKYRNFKATKSIMGDIKKYVYLKMKEKGLLYTYGALEKSFLRLLRMYKMDYETIGKVQKYGGELRFPAILYTKKLEEDNPILVNLWKEQHESK